MLPLDPTKRNASSCSSPGDSNSSAAFLLFPNNALFVPKLAAGCPNSQALPVFWEVMGGGGVRRVEGDKMLGPMFLLSPYPRMLGWK